MLLIHLRKQRTIERKASIVGACKALGMAEFGYEKVYINRLANAAKVQDNIKQLPIGDSMPERQLRPLFNVPGED